MAEESVDRRRRSVYRARPLVWFGPLIVLAFFLLVGFSAAVPSHEKAIILGVAAAPCGFLLLICFRSRINIEPQGLRLYQALESRNVEWMDVRGVAIRMHGKPARELIIIETTNGDIPVPGPVPGVFGNRYAQDAMADIKTAWQKAKEEKPRVRDDWSEPPWIFRRENPLRLFLFREGKGAW